ncbi:MAG: hypothetical protein Q9208_008420 [Pyrenodesmia sp. 3 TL-2023]
MSQLQYYTYPDYGFRLRETYSYNQAVRVGDRIECSGQGGWNPTSGEIKKDLHEEIDQAFENVDYNLKNAGGKGWSQVFRVNTYHTDMSDEALDHMVKNLRKWMPDHQPVLTVVGVAKLGREDMRIEVEVSAYIGA